MATAKTFTLDFRKITSMDGLWDTVDSKIGFKGFGRNLDAFNDLLRGGFGHFEMDDSVTITVLGAAHAEQVVGDKWKIIKEILDESGHLIKIE